MNIIVASFVLLTGVFALSGSVGAQESYWNLRKNKNGIEVYTRKIKNSGLIEFRATVTLNASFRNVRRVIDDVESYPVWIENLKKSRTIKKISGVERVDYYEIQAPWPFKNRDMVMQVKSIVKNNNIAHIGLMNSPDYVSAKQNIIRIREAKGLWHIFSIEKNKTRVTYQLYSDPGGYIPTWVVNLLIVHGPYTSLLNLKDRLKGV